MIISIIIKKSYLIRVKSDIYIFKRADIIDRNRLLKIDSN